MQARDPLVVARARDDAVFKGEGDEGEKIDGGVHVVGVAVDVEGVVAGGEAEDAGGWGVGGYEAGAVAGGYEGGCVGVLAGAVCWGGAIVRAVW